MKRLRIHLFVESMNFLLSGFVRQLFYCFINARRLTGENGETKNAGWGAVQRAGSRASCGENQARNLLKELDDSHERDQELRVAVIDQLFASAGQGIWIEPPLFWKIHLSSPR